MNNTKDRIMAKDNGMKTAVLAILWAVIATALEYLIYYILNDHTSIDPKLPSTVIPALIAVAVFVILGGKKWLKPEAKGFWMTWLFCVPILLYSLIQIVPATIWQIGEGVTPGVWGRIGFYFVAYVFVGLGEEFIFRGLIFGGLLRRLGKKKNGILTAAIISSLIFGYAHVVTKMDYTNIYSLMTGLLKTIQTGLFGFVLCYCCVKNKQIWGAAAFHAFDNFVLRLPALLVTMENHASYVDTEKDAALTSAVTYIRTIVIYLIPAVIAFIKIKKLDPTEAPFGEDSPEPQTEYAEAEEVLNS